MLDAMLKKIKEKEEEILAYVIEKIDNKSAPEIANANEIAIKKEVKEKKGRVRKAKKKVSTHMKVSTDVQLRAIWKSLKQNYIFYAAILIALYAFTRCQYKKSNFPMAVFSLFFVTCYGYFVHLFSHYMGTKLSEVYKTYDNIFTRNTYLNWLATKTIEFGEFHAQTHHDSEINKSKTNIALEFINNVVTQGGFLIMLQFFLKLLDNRVILLWAFFYATVHNINYNITSPVTHRQHHINDKTNYGIDIWDIIIGSKYDWETIETHNDAALNILGIAAVIVFCSNKFKL